MVCAPIALFVYNRPLHTQRTVEGLLANEGARESMLFVFSDGARDGSAKMAVEEVRRYVRGVQGFKAVEVVERSTNLGLAESIISGVTWLCSRFGRVIVVEDDLLTSRYFLKYLNEGLQVYADDPRVASIHAYLPPLKGSLPETFFFRGADCWGWATWARAWRAFQPDATCLLEALRRHPQRRRFDYLGSYPNTSMLKGYIARKNNSWAVRWHASAFVADMFSLYPGRTLVRNIGLDGSGTHCTDVDDLNSEPAVTPVQVRRIPVVDALDVWKQVRRFYRARYARKAIQRAWPLSGRSKTTRHA